MLSENLKLYRQKKGHTQESLAIQLHVVRQTVSKWEKGLSVPDAETLQRIAEVLEISVNDLLNTPAEETLPPSPAAWLWKFWNGRKCLSVPRPGATWPPSAMPSNAASARPGWSFPPGKS